MAEPQIGAFVELIVVDGLEDEEETETVIDYTTEDVEAERDPEEIDWVEHGNPRTQRREGHETTTTTFEMIVTDDAQNLQDAEMLDPETGQVLRNVRHDAFRLKWYDNEAALEEGDHSQSWTGEDAQFVFETLNAPIDDVSTIETAVWIHGPSYFDDVASA